MHWVALRSSLSSYPSSCTLLFNPFALKWRDIYFIPRKFCDMLCMYSQFFCQLISVLTFLKDFTYNYFTCLASVSPLFPQDAEFILFQVRAHNWWLTGTGKALSLPCLPLAPTICHGNVVGRTGERFGLHSPTKPCFDSISITQSCGAEIQEAPVWF